MKFSMNLKSVAYACAVGLICGGANAATVGVIDGTHNVIGGTNSGHLGLDGLGHTSILYTDTSTGYSAALASGVDFLIIEQDAEDAAPIAALQSFMSAGGRIIQLGGSGSGFHNALLGGAISYTYSYDPSRTWAKQAATAGTSFADDPASIAGLSSYHSVTSGLPAAATVFYGGPGDEMVYSVNYGSGDFFYLGWDFCCGGTDAQANDWYAVLDSAIEYQGSVSPVPLPAGLPLALVGLGALGFVSRRRKSS
ncbi:VPLPA-CTERM sorting domain-containing protein [Antarctobacter jejuensis]|uniref:VPLPA-CTERM sorting domain-containing protein n=1 Tax=Antarctobacter jejuensis TaxID=1439938 RepID=UPI003FCF0FC4